MLTVVSGNAQLLKRRLQDPKYLRSIEAIELAAARSETLTRQLLAFSRRQALNPIVISLRQHLSAFHELLASSARGERPKDRPIPVPQLLSTLYHAIGIDPSQTFPSGAGRPMYILDDREPVKELL